MPPHVDIGFNGRFFPVNWRPALDEIEFASANGFRCLQFHGPDGVVTEDSLGETFSKVGHALRVADLTVVQEIVVRVDATGRDAAGRTPFDVLRANISAIVRLRCTHVHWHLVPAIAMTAEEIDALERSLVPQFAAGVELARQQGFQLGIEHNEPDIMLFGTPESCVDILAAVPGLQFVWDINHTPPGQFDSFAGLLDRTSMLHVSDTPLPELNWHLPLGSGSVNFDALAHTLTEAKFFGPAVLEIGGLPKSGGYGRDTDAALIDSLYKLSAAFL